MVIYKLTYRLFLKLTIFTTISSLSISTLFLTNGLEAMENSKIIIAHRGASGYLPEHTLEAKALAHSFNVDYIEQDVVLTKDNIPVILHDVYIEDTTNVAQVYPAKKRSDGHYYAIDFSLNELKQLNVYERFDVISGNNVFPNRFPAKKSNFKISTLQEELELIQGLNKSRNKNIGIYVELKQAYFHQKEGRDLAAIVLPILKQYGYQNKDDNFYLQSFDFDEIKRLRDKLNYKGKLIFLISDNLPNKQDQDAPNTNYDYFKTNEGLKVLSKYVDGIGPHYSYIILDKKNGKVELSNLVKDAHNYGLLVHIYTLRDDSLPSYYKNAKDFVRDLFYVAEVDGIFSDFPDTTLNAIKRS
jgi:glycerophosphoryl diester phosphodiesterase